MCLLECCAVHCLGLVLLVPHALLQGFEPRRHELEAQDQRVPGGATQDPIQAPVNAELAAELRSAFASEGLVVQRV